MIIEALLRATLATGFGMLAKVQPGDELRAWQAGLTAPDSAYHRAFGPIWQKLEPLLEDARLQVALGHSPFQYAVVRGILEPEAGLRIEAAQDVLGDDYRGTVRTLRRFFQALEDALYDDAIWGPLLERYQALSTQVEVQQALQERQVSLDAEELVPRVHALLTGAGAIAQQGSVAAGAGGVAISGSVIEVVLQKIMYEGRQPEAAVTQRQRYLSRLRDQCSALPLAALGGDANPEQSVTLDQVYIDLLTTTRLSKSAWEAIERGDEADWSQLKEQALPAEPADAESSMWHTLRGQNNDEAISLPAQTAMRLSPRLALLGEAGAGKSTFARRMVARLAAGEGPAWLSPDLLPIVVTLRDVAPKLAGLDLGSLPAAKHLDVFADTMRDHMCADLSSLDATGFKEGLIDALNTQKSFLVFDGLDEVAPDHRHLVRRAVDAVLTRYRPPRVLLTCRVRSYVGEAVFPGFEAFTLAPFTDEQVEAFAHAWYGAYVTLGHLGQVQAELKARDLARAARTKDLRELAANPMLLTTMALIHYQDVGLPKERVRLYARAVELLLYRWQREKEGEDNLLAFLRNDRRVRQVMERLAYEAHRGGEADAGEASADVTRHQVQDLLEEMIGDVNQARAFLNYVDQRAGLLLGRGGDPGHPALYSFPHRTFQEYLAGCYLLTGTDRDRVARFYRCAAHGDRWNLAAQLGAEELYFNTRNGEQQLLHLAYNLLADDLGREQDQRASLWALQMAALVSRKGIERDVSNPSGGVGYLRRLRPRGVALLSSGLSAPERNQAGIALSQLGDPRFRANAWHLPDEPLLGFVAIPAGTFLMGSDENEDERPPHNLDLPLYYISRYPVTVAQFRVFVEESGITLRRPAALEGHGNYPVVWVTWAEALSYGEWLTSHLRSWDGTPAPLGEMLRDWGGCITLPSEAEWEKAARGHDGRHYPWGDEADPNLANFDQTGIGDVSVVGCFAGGASPYGIQDMSGNVCEWTRSVWGKGWRNPAYGYPYNSGDGREDLQAPNDMLRVLRGGSYWLPPQGGRCAYRDGVDPRYAFNYYVGFRVVLAVLP